MQQQFRRIHRPCSLCAILVFVCLASVLTASADESPCDQNLLQNSSDLGYQLRGDRCEGLYVQNVGSTILSVLSLTTAFAEYDLESGEALKLEWATPQPQDEVHVRAHDLRQRLYYRMDAIRPATTNSYTWPSDILAALEIPQRDLGVLAWMPYALGKHEEELLLPLQVRQQDASSQNQGYRMVLWPGQELTEVYISLATLDAEGNPKDFLKDGEALNYGYYPAQQHRIRHLRHDKPRHLLS